MGLWLGHDGVHRWPWAAQGAVEQQRAGAEPAVEAWVFGAHEGASEARGVVDGVEVQFVGERAAEAEDVGIGEHVAEAQG